MQTEVCTTRAPAALSENGWGVYATGMKEKWIFRVAVICLLGTVMVLGGCGNDIPLLSQLTFVQQTPLQIQSIEKKGTLVQPNFSGAIFYPDNDRVVHVVAEATGTDPATGQPVKQVMIMRIFWIPYGGRTSMNPTSLNFTFRYLVTTAEGAGQYEGAGFARVNHEPDVPDLAIKVMDADFRLTEKTGKFVDVLQRCRVVGTINARRDDPLAIEKLLTVKQEFFQTTLDFAKVSTQPASKPATGPSASTTATTTPATSTAPATTTP